MIDPNSVSQALFNATCQSLAFVSDFQDLLLTHMCCKSLHVGVYQGNVVAFGIKKNVNLEIFYISYTH